MMNNLKKFAITLLFIALAVIVIGPTLANSLNLHEGSALGYILVSIVVGVSLGLVAIIMLISDSFKNKQPN